MGQSKPVQMAEVEQSENLLQVAPRRSATQRPDRLERARCKTEARALPALASTPVPAAEAHMAPKFCRAHGRWPAMLFGVVVGGVAGASAVSLAAIGVGVLGPQSQTAPHVSVGEAADAAHDQASDPQQTPPVDASLMEPGTPPPSFPLALTNATVGALPTPPAEEVESPAFSLAALRASVPEIPALPSLPDLPGLVADHRFATPVPDLSPATAPFSVLQADAPSDATPVLSAREAERPALSAATLPAGLPAIPPSQPAIALSASETNHQIEIPAADPADALAATSLHSALLEHSQPQMLLAALGPDKVAPAHELQVSLVAVYAPQRLAADQRDWAVSRLSQTGWPTNESVTPFTIRESHVRYFHPQDRAAAEELATLLETASRDFTSFTPSPAPGYLEVWLGGRGAPPQARPATTRTAAVTAQNTRTARASAPAQTAGEQAATATGWNSQSQSAHAGTGVPVGQNLGSAGEAGPGANSGGSSGGSGSGGNSGGSGGGGNAGGGSGGGGNAGGGGRG